MPDGIDRASSPTRSPATPRTPHGPDPDVRARPTTLGCRANRAAPTRSRQSYREPGAARRRRDLRALRDASTTEQGRRRYRPGTGPVPLVRFLLVRFLLARFPLVQFPLARFPLARFPMAMRCRLRARRTPYR